MSCAGQLPKGGVHARQRGPSAADGGASGSHNTSPFTRAVPVRRGRPFFFARMRGARQRQHNTKGGRTDDDDNDGNRTPDDGNDGGNGERAQGCCEAAGGHHEGARGHDGCECGIPVADLDGAQAVDAEDAPEGRGGPGRGPRPGDCLPPGRRRERREQLHPGARPRDGHDHEGPGRADWGFLQLHDPGGPGPPAHGRQGPGQGRVGAARSGEDRSRAVRQPPRGRGDRRVQLHPGAGQGAGHEHEGAGRAGRGVPRLLVADIQRPREHGRESPGADRVGVGGSGEGRSRAASLHRPRGDVGPDGRSRLQPERGCPASGASALRTSPTS